MTTAPRGERLIIALTGRRNVGKSSFINALTGQDIAIVDDMPGTTTDPVAKQYELIPVGPVTFYDTAGFDDTGDIGEKRVKATEKILWRSDIAVLITDEGEVGSHELDMISKFERMDIPFVIVRNKCDISPPSDEYLNLCSQKGWAHAEISAAAGTGVETARELIIRSVPSYFSEERMIVGDLIGEGDLVVLVVPIDLAAPKGRLILPQVQVIREVLDSDAVAVTVKERELEEALRSLSRKPSLVITDSQVVLKVAGDIPDDVPFTTFSTLFARYKGDIDALVRGAARIDTLADGDRILIAEACSHHVQSDDIGRVKIPRWMATYTGKKLDFDVASGHDFPDDLEKYALVVHCGGCMMTGMEMKRRIRQCVARGVEATNYGVAISKLHGLLDRVIRPFGI